MNADAFRHFYEYHFAENRKIWDSYVTSLSDDQFRQAVSADDYWFSGLRGVVRPEPLNPADFDNRNILRIRWDGIEQNMRGYLVNLQDRMLFEKPFKDGEDEELPLWQALLHVANHGTDHRAQILRLLNDLGVTTISQDYIFYIYENL